MGIVLYLSVCFKRWVDFCDYFQVILSGVHELAGAGPSAKACLMSLYTILQLNIGMLCQKLMQCTSALLSTQSSTGYIPHPIYPLCQFLPMSTSLFGAYSAHGGGVSAEVAHLGRAVCSQRDAAWKRTGG